MSISLINFELYLNDIYIPTFQGGVIQGGVNQPASATVSIAPHPMLWDSDVQACLARCPVAIYYNEPAKGVKGDYRTLLFEGEITGMSMVRSRGNLSFQLHLKDISSYYSEIGIYEYDPFQSFNARLQTYSDFYQNIMLNPEGVSQWSFVLSDCSIRYGLIDNIWNALKKAFTVAADGTMLETNTTFRLANVLRYFLQDGEGPVKEAGGFTPTNLVSTQTPVTPKWGLLKHWSDTEIKERMIEPWVAEQVKRWKLDKRLKVVDTNLAEDCITRMTEEMQNRLGGMILGKSSIFDILFQLGEIINYDISIVPSFSRNLGEPDYSGNITTNSIIFKPMLRFGFPPECNVISSGTGVSFSWSRDMLDEPTRVLDKCSFFGIDQMIYDTPEASGDNKAIEHLNKVIGPGYIGKGVVFQNNGKVKFPGSTSTDWSESSPKESGASPKTGPIDSQSPVPVNPGAWNVYEAIKGHKTVVFEHGPEAYYQISKTDTKTILTPQEKLNEWVRDRAIPYFYTKFYNQNMVVSSDFNPYPVAGFPILILEREDYHLLGYLTSYTHTFQRGMIGSQFTVSNIHPYTVSIPVTDTLHNKDFVTSDATNILYEKLFGVNPKGSVNPGPVKSIAPDGYNLSQMKEVVDNFVANPARGRNFGFLQRPIYNIKEHRAFLTSANSPFDSIKLNGITTPKEWNNKTQKTGLQGGKSEVNRKTIINKYVALTSRKIQISK